MMLILRTRFLLALVVLCYGLVGTASARPGDQDADREAIAKQATAFVEAYARADAAALAKFWAPDGEYTDLDGRTLRGRKAIAADFADFFRENESLKLRIEVLSVRFPAPDTAVEEGVTTVLGPEGALPSRASYTNVLVKRDGVWLLWSVRETPYIPPSHYEHLRDLEWMIGEWIEDRDGNALSHAAFEWSVDRNFILVTRSVILDGMLLDNGSERIGWDPAAKLVRSWSFESDGGFGEGTWTRDGNKWTTRSSSVLASGSLMTSKATVTRTGPDSITWQMTERVVNGNAVPDSPVLKIKRVQ